MIKNLVIRNIFCQPLGASLYKGSTLLNFIYLFFKKWGGGGGALAPHRLPQPGP